MASHSCLLNIVDFHSHTTAGHRCGICGKFGHGQIECNNPRLKVEPNSIINRVANVKLIIVSLRL